MEKLEKNGTTDKWSNFKAPVLSAFEWYNSSLERKDYFVTFFYDVNKFSKYVFLDIESPEFVVTSKTWVGGNFLSFFYEPFNEMGGLMSDFITPRAVISDTTQFVIIGDRNLCKADITEDLGPLVSHSSTS